MSEFSSKLPGVGWSKPFFQLGKGRTLAVPMETHEIARKKLVGLFAEKDIKNGIILLKGGEQQSQYDSDTEPLFRQDSWFNYLFGVKESGFYGAICLSTGKTTLFMPKLGPDYRIWCGEIFPPEHFQIGYGVDEVIFIEDLPTWMKEGHAIECSCAAGSKIHVMTGTNIDSGAVAKPARFEGDEEFWSSNQVDPTTLYHLLSLSRVHKSPEEIEIMRYCALVSSNAHVEVMKIAQNCSFEYELEAKFLFEIYSKGGCRRCAYTSVCACGPNSSVIHYGHAAAPNDRQLSYTDMALLDMGAEYHGYTTDLTCSFPISGKFTTDQKTVYEGVLDAQRAVYEIMKPGISWQDCHLAAEKAVLAALHNGGILVNGSIKDYIEAQLGPVFFPHGLGHLIGCDMHDVGGYIPGTPLKSTSHGGLSKLRTSRILETGMVITNEPGCYFIDSLLVPALSDPKKSKFINVAVLDRFKHFGGVRIEDVVLITENGPETLSNCPRSVKEIENVIAGGSWPPEKDECPELKRRWTRLSRDATRMEFLNL